MILMIEHGAIVQSAQRLPPLPQSATRLLALTADNRADLREIVQVVEFDPVLTMKLLRMANSIAGGSAQRVARVHDAVIRLGTRTVADLAVAASVQPLFPKHIPGYNISGADFWKHSLAAALATACFPGGQASAAAFTAALLHDIGKLVLGQLLSPPLLTLLDRAQREGNQDAFHAEMEILAIHHGEVGGVVAQHWRLPESIVEGIIHHHSPELGREPTCSITCLANYVAHAAADRASVQAGEIGMNPPDFVLQAVGISLQQYGTLCRTVGQRLEAVVAAYAT